MPDYRANLVARELLTQAERETYVRHNIRSLRDEYPPPLLWRMLIRYLFEYQYLGRALGMTRIANARDYFSPARGSQTISSPRACSTRRDSRRWRRQSDASAPATPSIARDSACPPTDRARRPHDSAAPAG
jgi:hypothetical protein